VYTLITRFDVDGLGAILKLAEGVGFFVLMLKAILIPKRSLSQIIRMTTFT